MNFYNPFKPHVIKRDNFYYIRRSYSVFWWRYLVNPANCYRGGKVRWTKNLSDAIQLTSLPFAVDLLIELPTFYTEDKQYREEKRTKEKSHVQNIKKVKKERTTIKVLNLDK